MTNRKEMQKTLTQLILPYADCIAWKDFLAKGTPCYKPYQFNDKKEELDAAQTYATTLLSVPKYGFMHRALTKRIAPLLNVKRLSYDFLVNIIARLLAGATYEQVENLCRTSRQMRGLPYKMRGLPYIV